MDYIIDYVLEYKEAFIASGVVLLIIFIAFLVVKGKKTTEEPKTDVKETTVEEPVVEETTEEPVVEPAVEEPVVEEPTEEPVVEEPTEEPVVEPAVEEPVVEETTEEPVVEPAVEEQTEEPVVEEPTEVTDTRYSGKFTLQQDASGFKYNLLASNGENLIISEPYTTIQGVLNGIETLKKNSQNIEVVDDKHGLFRFIIKSGSNRVLAQSANYNDKSRAVSASQSFLKFVKTAIIVKDVEVSNNIEEVEKVEVALASDGKFIISSEEGGFYYVLKASNGRTICESHGYKTLRTCTSAINNFKEVVYNGDFVISKDKNNMYQFRLYNTSKRLIMTGEVYKTKQTCVKVVESIKRFAKLSEIS